MNWITKEEVMKAAKESELAAVQCSRKHWEQLNQAIPTELAKGFWSGMTNLGTDYCALCMRNGPNRPCPCPLESCKAGTVYGAAENAVNALKVSVAGSGLIEHSLWEEWQKASKAMVDRLFKIEQELLKALNPIIHKTGQYYKLLNTWYKGHIYKLTKAQFECRNIVFFTDVNDDGNWNHGCQVAHCNDIVSTEWNKITGIGEFELVEENKDDRG